MPHRLYGIVSAAEAYSVGRWLDDVGKRDRRSAWEGRLPILVGGTGLYFKALTEGLAPVPDIPAEIRAYWRERSRELGREALHDELAARDPAMAARLGPADPQRIVRALEVIDATGVSLAEWQGGDTAPLLAPGDASEARHRAGAGAALCGHRCALRSHDRAGRVGGGARALGAQARSGLAGDARAWRARIGGLSRRRRDPAGGGGEGQDRDPPLRQAADDLGTTLHGRLGLVP